MSPNALSPRTITRYNQLCAGVAAFKYALDRQKPGPAAVATVMALNRLVALANRVYAREPDVPKFHPLMLDSYSTGDLALALAPLLLAGLNFEDRYQPEPEPYRGR